MEVTLSKIFHCIVKGQKSFYKTAQKELVHTALSMPEGKRYNNGDYSAHFWTVSPWRHLYCTCLCTQKVTEKVLQTKKKLKSCSLLHRTSGQLGIFVRLSVLETKIDGCTLSQFRRQKILGERWFQMLFEDLTSTLLKAYWPLKHSLCAWQEINHHKFQASICSSGII